MFRVCCGVHITLIHHHNKKIGKTGQGCRKKPIFSWKLSCSIGQHWLLWSRLVGSSKVTTSTESATLVLVHRWWTVHCKLVQKCWKSMKFLNSADYVIFLVYILRKFVLFCVILFIFLYFFWDNGDFYKIKEYIHKLT